MELILILLLIAVCFFSVITTFIALITILTNDFEGDKTTWVLISMIGLFGPILWLTKGRKLVKKK